MGNGAKNEVYKLGEFSVWPHYYKNIDNMSYYFEKNKTDLTWGDKSGRTLITITSWSSANSETALAAGQVTAVFDETVAILGSSGLDFTGSAELGETLSSVLSDSSGNT